MRKLLLPCLLLFLFCSEQPGVTTGTEARILVSDKEALIAVDEKALDELMKSFAAKDWQGVVELNVSGRVFPVPSHTKVLIIDQSFGKRKIRIDEGKQSGKTGWLPMEYLASIK